MTLIFGVTLAAQEVYELGNDSKTYKGIPKGVVTKYIWESSYVFPNTVRDYYVYVPKQYDKGSEAALMVFQDGHAYIDSLGHFRVATVFDNLISQGKMPVTIGLFVNPGHDKDAEPVENPFRVTNRSNEYDDVSGKYGDFLLKELIPELKKKYTISDDPKMRAISGLSSGGICAFSVAWFHPDKFQKVLSHIGSFTNINGGHNYPSMIRKTEKKDIKVFLQDGSNDLNNEHGNWWLANLQMKSSLEYMKYDFKFVGGEGKHSGAHGGAILPESLEWLWKDRVTQNIPESVFKFSENSTLADGETFHYKNIKLETMNLGATKTLHLTNVEREQIIIIKEGELKVRYKNNQKDLGPNSVIVLHPGDKGSIQGISDNVKFYKMSYISRKPIDKKRGRKNGGSYVVDFDELEFKPHDKGGLRNYFRKATTMCPYYEMHVTNLNPNVKSHDPHTHNASEIILMIDGETEMEMGNGLFKAESGDVYFVPANVPHAIKNVGEKQAMYFAYQWE